MNKTFALCFFGILACLQTNQRAFADEVWQTYTQQFGDVVYEEDRGKTAIWSYGNNKGKLFIEGLAGQYDHRGTYFGYWAQDTYSSPIHCDTFREGEGGLPTNQWGRIEIEFLDPNFPSRWIIKMGRCEEQPTIKITATPLVK